MGLLIGVIAVFIAYRLGWEAAHVTVAKECERLGSFFVGKKTYRCTAIEPKTGES
jgi:hypothetical protein